MSKVTFVGAGPGDIELITLKGYNALKKADVVIYAGSLINHELLNYCKDNCEFHDSAKLNLYEIIQLMKEGIDSKKEVVRYRQEIFLYMDLLENKLKK